MANTALNPRGYGPHKSLQFTGEAETFELWEVKFKAYLRLNSLHKVIETVVDGDEDRNAEVYAALVQVLDDKSLNLIIRDAPDDGRKSLEILRAHYLGTSKPQIISLYCELTSLKIGSSETVTEYMLRAEKAATRLKQAKEVVSDGLLVAMILKGLPDSYKAFCTIITQSDSESLNFQKFKSSLRSYEESEKSRTMHSENSDEVFSLICYNCGKPGHMKAQCRVNKPKVNHGNRSGTGRWCANCRSATHDTKFCRRTPSEKSNQSSNSKINNAKSNSNNEKYFVFKVTVHPKDNVASVNSNEDLLVDCGATTHIIYDINKFVKIDDSFDANCHVIELADCSRQKGIVTAKGDAKVEIVDSTGKNHDVILKNALCIPSYKQNILSVYAMTERGMKVIFTPNNNKIVAPNNVVFNINKKGKLYYLNNLVNSVPSDNDQNNICKIPTLSKTLEEWHYILGHCNVPDLLKLEKNSDGMVISEK